MRFDYEAERKKDSSQGDERPNEEEKSRITLCTPTTSQSPSTPPILQSTPGSNQSSSTIENEKESPTKLTFSDDELVRKMSVDSIDQADIDLLSQIISKQNAKFKSEREWVCGASIEYLEKVAKQAAQCAKQHHCTAVQQRRVKIKPIFQVLYTQAQEMKKMIEEQQNEINQSVASFLGQIENWLKWIESKEQELSQNPDMSNDVIKEIETEIEYFKQQFTSSQ